MKEFLLCCSVAQNVAQNSTMWCQRDFLRMCQLGRTPWSNMKGYKSKNFHTLIACVFYLHPWKSTAYMFLSKTIEFFNFPSGKIAFYNSTAMEWLHETRCPHSSSYCRWPDGVPAIVGHQCCHVLHSADFRKCWLWSDGRLQTSDFCWSRASKLISCFVVENHLKCFFYCDSS